VEFFLKSGLTAILIVLGMLLVTRLPALADEAGGKNKMTGWAF
jgi:hypothetical protein